MKSEWKTFVKKYLTITIVFIIFLIVGSASTILNKTAYQTEAEGRDGDVHYFTKPLFFNWGMFLGMSLCMIMYFIQYHLLPLFKKDERKEKKKSMTWKGYLLMLIPALFDFAATYLMNFALIVVSSNIFQIMKGCVILFTALLAVFYRKHKMYLYEIVGVIIIVVSLVVIGSATFCPGYQTSSDESSLSGEESTTSIGTTLLGILLIVIGQFLQALQTIVEEQFLHDISAPVTFVVGLEGFYGLIICSCLMPIMGMDWIPDDLYEDTKDTFIMLGNSPLLIFLFIADTTCVFIFNITGMIITDYISAMVRNIMEPLRMILIWIVSVFLFYVVDESIGEKVGWFTILEVIGFILLTFGFLLYTKVIKIPQIFKYPTKSETEDEEQRIQPEKTSSPSSDNSEKPLLSQ